MLNDVLAGVIAFCVVIVLSFMTGGFSFFTPWILWSVIVFLVVGLLRGSPYQSVWPKVLTINSIWIVAGSFLAGGDWWIPFAAFAVTSLPTAAGVYLKRRFTRTTEP
jgi:hypothetical protein